MSGLNLDRLASFIDSLRDARDLKINLDRGTMLRLRAVMDRVERDQPGLSYEPGEPDDQSLVVAVLSLLDRGLTESERDANLRYDFMGGQLVPLANAEKLRTRTKRAWRVLRRGW